MDKLPILLIDHPDERPQTNFRLIRLCEWGGQNYSQFTHLSAGQARPHGIKAALAMGPKATEAFGFKLPLAKIQGYVHQIEGVHVIPTYSPGYIQRGNAKYSAPFINDLQKAVWLAEHGMPPQVTRYQLDPSPLSAYRWAEQYRARLTQAPVRLAFDIETPGKGEDEDDVDTDADAPDRTWHIDRIGFSYDSMSALSIPWAPEYIAAIRLLMESDGEKVVWNAGFDVPRIRRSGVGVNGLVHDGMVAWHILHSDLPKRLGFVATFTCPWQPAWKHLSGARPAFYNATDADVEWRSFERIEEQLKVAGLWEVYQRDVVELDPILVFLQKSGMPVDPTVRLDRAIKLAADTKVVRETMELCVPLEARKIEHVYINEPKETGGLLSRPSTRMVSTCPGCGLQRPRKDHFKRFVKKHNPCGGMVSVEIEQPVTEYYRLARFTPSGDQLTRYHHWLKRPLPMTWDNKTRTRKVSFGEEKIRELILKYPDDKLYAAILDYRGLDKLAGTYIGRPVED